MLKKRLISMMLTVFITLTAIISVGASTAFGTETAEETAAFIGEVIVNYYGAASVQYAVIDNGEIVISGTSVAPTLEDEITDKTMYGIGSVSKMYTATAVMQLVDEGKIDLDTPITEYIPEFTMKDERYKDITVRMLLNHSSGIYGTTNANAFVFDTYDAEIKTQLLASLAEQNLKANPGEFSVYCNDGFTLAEIIIERVSGVSYPEYLQEYILTPIEAANTATPADDFDRANLAATYVDGEATPVDSLNVIGTGGIYSTAADLVNFAQAFMKDSNELLSKEAVEAMAAYEFDNGIWPEIADNIMDYGLGWDSVRLFPLNRYEIQALSKGGDTLLYHSTLVVLPEYNIAMAIVMSGGSSEISSAMASSVLLDLLLEKGEIDEILPDAAFEPSDPIAIPEEYDEYFGYYATQGGIATFEKNEDGTELLAYYPMMPDKVDKLLYFGDGIFMPEDASYALKFVKEDNGNIYISQRVYAPIPYVGQIAMNLYTHQKIEIGSVDEAVAEAWAARNNKIYLLVSEPYNSQLYSIGSSSTILAFVLYSEEVADYFTSNKIIDENTAVNILQIPVLFGRDTVDYIFYEDANSGVEYLSAATITFADAESFADIYNGRTSHATINDKGHSKWYFTGEAAGKTMTVNVPENSAFAVYDEDLNCVFYSYSEQGNSVILPENGAIVFIGETGTRFDIILE